MRCSPRVWERRRALSCQEARELIHGYVDGEVDLVRSLEIEEHLRDCHACSHAYKGIRSLRSTLSDSALRFDPPANFERRLRSALRGESAPESRSVILRWPWLV